MTRNDTRKGRNAVSILLCLFAAMVLWATGCDEDSDAELDPRFAAADISPYCPEGVFPAS